MFKTKSLTTLFCILSFTLSSFSQTPTEINQIENEEYMKADANLNRVYKQILSDYKTNSKFIEKLRSSQRLWIKFRDAELEMKFPEEDKRLNYGSMYPMCATNYLAELTKQRTTTLKKWLKPTTEGESCNGSLMYRELPTEPIVETVENILTLQLLNNFTLLKDFKTPHLRVKIISLNNSPEGTGFSYDNTNNDIYIAVSELGEYPNQNLFSITNLKNPEIKNIKLSDDDKASLDIIHGNANNRKALKINITVDEIKTDR